MDISFTERETIAGMVKQLMIANERQIEEAYLATEGIFKIPFVVKVEPQANAKKVSVEMSFDPAQKVKDRMSEILDPGQPHLPFKERNPEE